MTPINQPNNRNINITINMKEYKTCENEYAT